LDEETRGRIKAMNPRVGLSPSNVVNDEFDEIRVVLTQQKISGAKKGTSDPFDTMIKNFEQSIALDASNNKYRMEIPIHSLFVKGEEGNFESLNRKIYDVLFLTPKSDPYLGLGSDGAFTALQNGGIIQTASQ
jgi:hypothetical protein